MNEIKSFSYTILNYLAEVSMKRENDFTFLTYNFTKIFDLGGCNIKTPQHFANNVIFENQLARNNIIGIT